MRKRLILSVLVLAVAACDRVTTPFHRDAGPDSLASEWEHVDAGSVNYNAVSGSDPNNVFIVGDQGTILHWDGLALQREESGTYANLRGVHVVDEAIAYAVGEQGTVLLRQGDIWTPQPPVTSAVLNGVLGGKNAAGQDIAAAVGEQGTVLTFASGVWHVLGDEYRDNLYAVIQWWGGIQAIGATGTLRLINVSGSIAAPTSIPNFQKVLAGAAYISKSYYAGGVDGALFLCDDKSYTLIGGLPQKFIRAISVEPTTNTAWIVGHEGLVASLPEGGSPTVIPAPDDTWLLGVYAASPSDVWVVGRSGVILRGPPGVRGKDGGVL